MKHSRKFNLVIIGPSGAGKGTQAIKIAERYGLKHISMGVVFRLEIKEDTAYGKQVKNYIDRGEFVPTQLVLEGLAPILKSINYCNFILDGFPRLPDQPAALDKVLKQAGSELDMVFHLDIRPEMIVQRMNDRRAKDESFYKTKRKDDNLQSIKRRIKEYQGNIDPILRYYNKKGILRRIDGERPVKPIFDDIVKIIDAQILSK